MTTLDLALKNGFKLDTGRRNGHDVRKDRDKGTRGSTTTQRTKELRTALEIVTAFVTADGWGETRC